MYILYIYVSYPCILRKQGTGPEVPKYLSFDGPVRNRRLGKRDALLLIRDMWREKAAADAEVIIPGHVCVLEGRWGVGGCFCLFVCVRM